MNPAPALCGCLQQLVIVSVLLLPLPVHAEPLVRVERQGDAFAVRVETAIAADTAVAWQVLTDYNRLAEFVPDMRASRVLSAPGEALRIEQQGEAGFLLFKFAIDVELAIEETPLQRLSFRAIRGNMKRADAITRVVADGAITKIVMHSESVPDFWLPGFMGRGFIERSTREQFVNLRNEILRRKKPVIEKTSNQ